MAQRLLIYCDGGFGNRYNALISGLAAAELLGCEAVAYWPVNNWCGAEYREMFAVDPGARDVNLIDLKGEAPGWLILSHDLRNAEYLGVPFVSAYGFAGEAGFAEYCRKDGRDIFFYPALVPPWLSPERVAAAARRLQIHPGLVQAADAFIEENLPESFYGIHLRRTDLVLGYTDAEVDEIVSRHPERRFFVCSDSADSEAGAARHDNVRVRGKQCYVERQAGGKGWCDVTLDDSQRAYASNVTRNAQSVREALVDLLVLSRSTIVGKSGSTFLNVARFLGELAGSGTGSLPAIDTIPIGESFRRGAAGVLDLLQAITAAQQLWIDQRRDEAVALLRLWLKHPNSPHSYPVFFNLALYLEQLGHLHESESHLRQVLYLNPPFLKAHLQLGLLLEKTGRRDEAAAQWLVALGLPPDVAARDQEAHSSIASQVGRLLRGAASS